jgi:hypothetical protein
MRRAALIVAGVMITAGLAFAGETPLISDPLVAPATGSVTYQRQGQQTRLSLKVSHLKAASELKPSPRKVYVVWVQEPNKQWHNVGALHVNNGQATLTASVATENMFILITAENDSHGSAPAGPEVMQATVLGP